MEKKYNWQICQEETLTEEFSNLHKKLVNEIILFCKKNNVQIEGFNLSADGICNSIPYGEWTPGTDSSFVMYRLDEINNRGEETVKPFLYSI